MAPRNHLLNCAVRHLKDQDHVPNVIKSNPAYTPVAATMIMEPLSRPHPSQTFVVVVNVVILVVTVMLAPRMIVVLIMSIVVHQQVGVAPDHAAQIVDAKIVAPKTSPSAAVRMIVVILKRNNVVVGIVMHSAAISIGTAVPAIIPVHSKRVTSV